MRQEIAFCFRCTSSRYFLSFLLLFATPEDWLSKFKEEETICEPSSFLFLRVRARKIKEQKATRSCDVASLYKLRPRRLCSLSLAFWISLWGTADYCWLGISQLVTSSLKSRSALQFCYFIYYLYIAAFLVPARISYFYFQKEISPLSVRLPRTAVYIKNRRTWTKRWGGIYISVTTICGGTGENPEYCTGVQFSIHPLRDLIFLFSQAFFFFSSFKAPQGGLSAWRLLTMGSHQAETAGKGEVPLVPWVNLLRNEQKHDTSTWRRK